MCLGSLQARSVVSSGRRMMCGLAAVVTEAMLAVSWIETLKVRLIVDQKTKTPRFGGLHANNLSGLGALNNPTATLPTSSVDSLTLASLPPASRPAPPLPRSQTRGLCLSTLVQGLQIRQL